MKTKTIIIALLAATLCACGGGTTQNQGQQGTDNGKAATDTATVATNDQPAPAPEGIAYDILKAIAQEGKYGIAKDADLNKFFDGEFGYGWKADAEHNYCTGYSLDLFPLYNKGYFVIYTYAEETPDREKVYTNYFEYIDSTLKSGFDRLPDPMVGTYYSNFDRFPTDELMQLQQAMGSEYFYSRDDGKLYTTLDPYYDLKDDYPESMKTFLEQKFPTLHYTWIEGQFKLDSVPGPVECDLLKCFGIESDEVRKAKFLAALPNYYTDSVYEFHTEICNPFGDFHSGSTDAYFPYKSGGYLVIATWGCESAGTFDSSCSYYKYIDGKTEDIKDALPIPESSNFLKNIHEIDDTKLYEELEKMYKENPFRYLSYGHSYGKYLDFSWYFDDEELYEKYGELLKYDARVTYEWDGEKFVKSKEEND